MAFPNLITATANVDTPLGSMGPFQIGSKYYVVLAGTPTVAYLPLEVWVSSDGGKTWAQTGVGGPTYTSLAQGSTVVLIGTKLYCVQQSSAPELSWFLNIFDTTTSTWEPQVTLKTGEDVSHLNSTEFETVNAVYVAVNNQIVVLSRPLSFQTSGRTRTAYFTINLTNNVASAWTACGITDPADTRECTLIHNGAVLGNGRVHFFMACGLFLFINNINIIQQSLENNGTLEAFQTVDTINTGGAAYPPGPFESTSCVASGNGTNVAVEWMPTVGANLRVFRGVSAPTITFKPVQIITNTTFTGVGMTFGSDGNLYLFTASGGNTGYYLDMGAGFGSFNLLGALAATFIEGTAVTSAPYALRMDGSVYFWVPASTSGVGQLAFYGVRRRKGFKNDPQIYTNPSYEKPYDIQTTVTIPTGWSKTSGGYLTSVLVADYEFELRRIDGFGGLTGTYLGLDPGNFKILLLDTNGYQISNIPVFLSVLFHVPNNIPSFNSLTATSLPKNFWPTPPMSYRVNSSIRFFIYATFATPLVAPVNMDITFSGIRRYPCK